MSSALPNIVFLDMDGVLCTHRACLAVENVGLFSYLDPIACQLVNKLCKETNAQIVISSAWRIMHNRSGMSALLNATCPHLGSRLVADATWWKTADFVPGIEGDGTSDRGREIQHWITNNMRRFDNYVILDDMADMRPLQDRLVRCDAFDGIGYRQYREAESILNEVL